MTSTEPMTSEASDPSGSAAFDEGGGSDLGPPADAGQPEGGAPEDVLAASSGDDPFDDEQTQVFDRGYVEKLRKEAASHRERAKSFEEAFSPLAEEDAAWMLNVTKLLATDPAQAAQMFRQAAEALAAEETPTEPIDPDAPLRAEDVKRILAEEREALQREEAVRKAGEEIRSTLKDLGYDDPASPAARLVLITAREEKIDLKEAHERIAKAQEEQVAKVLAERAAQNGQHPPVSRGAPASNVNKRPPWGSRAWQEMFDSGGGR